MEAFWHFLALDLGWWMAFLGLNIMFVFALPAMWHYFEDGKPLFPAFIPWVLVMWGVVSFLGLSGLTFFSQNHLGEWAVIVFLVTIFLAGTRLNKWSFAVLISIFLTLSWLVSPWG